MDDVLFQVTNENLETGLRGYPIGYCVTSTVDPMKGLFYTGKNVADLAYKQPEEVIYLLLFGKNGSKEEIVKFRKELVRRAECKPELLAEIQKLPRKGHPMQLLSIDLLMAAMYELVNDYKEDGLNVIAKIPVIVAYLINHHAGWGGCNTSNPELGYMENFAQMLCVPNANLVNLTEAFRLFNILHYDHGGGNLSAFVGKAVASGLEDMYGSLAAAMCALAGPRHGKANQDALEFLQEVLNEIGENATEDDLRKLLKKRLSENKLIYGFGHAVLRVEDPRATVLFNEMQKKFPKHPLVKIALLMRKVGPEVLKENPKISNPYPNVDLASGTFLVASGFPYPEYFTVLFGLARVVGIASQIIYERLEAREGKGTPIIRPKYIYKARETL